MSIIPLEYLFLEKLEYWENIEWIDILTELYIYADVIR